MNIVINNAIAVNGHFVKWRHLLEIQEPIDLWGVSGFLRIYFK